MTLSTTFAGGVPQRDFEMRHRGPAPGIVGIVFTVLFTLSLVVGALLAGGARFPTPYDPPEAIGAYFAQHASALRITAFLQFAAAIPLGIYTAAMTSRLRFHGITVAGVSIAEFGGFAAAFFLALAGLLEWVLAQPGVAGEASAARILYLLVFVTGGPGHVVPLGLLLAGISVPAAFTRLLPRWLVWLGLVTAVFAELATLSLVLIPAAFFIPMGRFLGFVWLIGAGFALPATKRKDNQEASA
jgi:hypothetical protein